jgi:DNA-binding beta-propeller fold protein YncE
MAGVLLLSPASRQVRFLCCTQNQVHFLKLTPSGLTAARSALVLPPGTDEWRRSVATGAVSTDGDVLGILRDGRIVEISENEGKVARIAMDKEITDKWIPTRSIPRSPDGSRLYVAVGSLTNRYTGMGHEILVVDSKTGQPVKTMKTSRPFWSLAISHDGRYLYAVSPQTQSLLVMDTNTYQEIRTIGSLGRSPVLAEVAP